MVPVARAGVPLGSSAVPRAARGARP
jgi:hypothetical protein